jgi:hypothetical protein
MAFLRAVQIFLSGFIVLPAIALCAQQPVTTTPPPQAANASANNPAVAPQKVPPIPANAPHMTKDTRFQIIRDFEAQLVYARSTFPMGTKGLSLKDGVTSPNGPALQQSLAVYGPAIKPGDPARISYVRIKGNCIHFDINGGPIRRQKWYQRIEIDGANGQGVTPGGGQQAPPNPHGSYLEVYFDKYVPEMTAAQLRNLLYPVLDFTAHNKEEAYLDTVPPKVKEAIKAHHVLVGMNSEMVLHAMGKPPRKDREKDADGSDFEEWIYGTMPQDVNFVRFKGDEVVRVETMKVGGQKIVRTEKEIELQQAEKETEAKKDQVRPANAPTLRRPGEDSDQVPKPSDGASPMPIPPPDIPPGGQGPGL